MKLASPLAPVPPLGAGLPHVGARVTISPKQDALWPGTVKFVGKTSFCDGLWVGVKLDDNLGKNDGSVQGVRYFTCAAGHGVFLRPNAVTVIDFAGPWRRGGPDADDPGGAQRRLSPLSTDSRRRVLDGSVRTPSASRSGGPNGRHRGAMTPDKVGRRGRPVAAVTVGPAERRSSLEHDHIAPRDVKDVDTDRQLHRLFGAMAGDPLPESTVIMSDVQDHQTERGKLRSELQISQGIIEGGARERRALLGELAQLREEVREYREDGQDAWNELAESRSELERLQGIHQTGSGSAESDLSDRRVDLASVQEALDQRTRAEKRLRSELSYMQRIQQSNADVFFVGTPCDVTSCEMTPYGGSFCESPPFSGTLSDRSTFATDGLRLGQPLLSWRSSPDDRIVSPRDRESPRDRQSPRDRAVVNESMKWRLEVEKLSAEKKELHTRLDSAELELAESKRTEQEMRVRSFGLLSLEEDAVSWRAEAESLRVEASIWKQEAIQATSERLLHATKACPANVAGPNRLVPPTSEDGNSLYESPRSILSARRCRVMSSKSVGFKSSSDEDQEDQEEHLSGTDSSSSPRSDHWSAWDDATEQGIAQRCLEMDLTRRR